MNTVDCIKSRRSIRRFKPDSVKHSLIEEIVSAASFSPSWKNTQITRYIAIALIPLEKKTAGRCLMPVWPVRRSVWLRTNTDWVLSLWAYLMRVEFPVFWTFQRNGNWLH